MDGSLQEFLMLPDDRILISGSFKRVNGRHCPHLCRLHADGSIDPTFGPLFLRPNNSFPLFSFAPPSMSIQADGKILLFGTQMGDRAWSLNYAHSGNLMRLTPDGLLDESFHIAEISHAPFRNATINVVVPLDDGRLLVGGSFNTINGVSRRNLVRLLPNGQIDPDFNADLSLPADPDNRNDVRLLTITEDGRLLVLTYDITNRPRALQRLNSGGSLDISFGTLPISQASGSTINALIALPDQQLLVGGLFAFGPGDLQGIFRLDAQGLVDPNFQAHTPDQVDVMHRLADGRVLVGGRLREFNGSSVRRLVRILPGGATDPSFVSPIEQGNLLIPLSSFEDEGISVSSLAIDAADNILAGGSFHGAANQTQARLLKLSPSGELLRDPDPEANDTVFTFAQQPDGHVLVGGRFTEIGGQPRARLARLKPDGSLDPDFTTGASSTVRAIGVQRDGKLIVAGAFGTLGGQTRSRIGRLNPDGSLDPDFNPNVTNSIRCLAIQGDGAMLIGGILTAVGGVPRSRMARIHPDGSLDINFNPAPNGEVRSITLDRLGRILVAGAFTTIGGVEQPNLARLLPDGSVDLGFTPVIDAEVRAIAIEARGLIRISGLISSVNGTPRSSVAILKDDGALADSFDFPNWNFDGPVNASISFSLVNDLQGNVGSYHLGDFSTVQGQPRAGFVSLGGFSSQPGSLKYNANDRLLAMLVTEDGRLMLGGDFSSITGVNRSRLAIVHSRDVFFSQTAPFPSSEPFIYFLNRRGPHLEHPMHFEFSLDGVHFTPFDSTTNFTPPAQNYFMRISGRSRTGFANSSSGLIEILDFLPGRGDTLFRDSFQ